MLTKIVEIPKNGKEWPLPRSGHRMCATENFLYIFGGYDPSAGNKLYNELWRYNITTSQWVKLPDHENLCPKECASSSMLMWRNFIVVFGGSGHPFALTNSNRLLLYSLKTFKWIDITAPNTAPNGTALVAYVTKEKECGCHKIKYKQPRPKYGQSMALYQDKLVLFSGTTGRHFTQELHRFNLEKMEWSKLKFCDQHGVNIPEGRYRHDAVIWKDKYFVLGGAVLQDFFGFDKLPLLNLRDNKWEVYETTSNMSIDEMHCYPPARKAHTCLYYNDRIYLLGGLQDNLSFNDFWCLDLKKQRWNYVPQLCLPYKIYFHAAAISRHGCLYIHGGVTDNETRTSNLHQIWLTVPSLIEQSWMKVVELLKSTNSLTKPNLLALGIPKKFMYRVEDSLAYAA